MKKVVDNNQFNELPYLALVPNHGKMDTLPNYPFCAKREIFCGPFLENEESRERRYIKTKGLFFNIDDIISQLDEKDLNFDLVFAPLEVNSSCFPKNLSKIECPKLAFVFDTHHLMYPISKIIDYIKLEKFTHVIMYAQPAHLHFFYEAGFNKSSSFQPIFLEIPFREKRKDGVTYIGNRWKSSHPRRCRMLQFLEKKLPRNNIPFHQYNRLPRDLWQKVLGRSSMIVISSLNGQFTPQINTCLFAGALCFVDELSPKTLLNQFYQDKKHLILWKNFDDLLEKIKYYYNHPKEAKAIAKAGQAQAKSALATSESFWKIISNFVFEDKVDPRFLATNDKRCIVQRNEPEDLFNARVRLYENLQELHRIHESLELISLTKNNLKPSTDLADLPRLNITHAFTSKESKEEGDLYFQDSGVGEHINTVILKDIQNYHSFDIGLIDKQHSQAEWRFLTNSFSKWLKRNALLCILGEISLSEKDIIIKAGFKEYINKSNPIFSKIKNISKRICLGFWKLGKYLLPYLTLKPSMKTVPKLNMFLRGWQAYFPYLY